MYFVRIEKARSRWDSDWYVNVGAVDGYRTDSAGRLHLQGGPVELVVDDDSCKFVLQELHGSGDFVEIGPEAGERIRATGERVLAYSCDQRRSAITLADGQRRRVEPSHRFRVESQLGIPAALHAAA